MRGNFRESLYFRDMTRLVTPKKKTRGMLFFNLVIVPCLFRKGIGDGPLSTLKFSKEKNYCIFNFSNVKKKIRLSINIFILFYVFNVTSIWIYLVSYDGPFEYINISDKIQQQPHTYPPSLSASVLKCSESLDVSLSFITI